MQSTMNPISPVGRAVLPTMQGASPDQATARAAEVAKTGLIPFDQAISMKQMADSISSSGGMMNQGPPETVVGSLRRQIQEAMNPPPAAPPAMNAGVAALPMPDDMYAGVGMAGGGIVAFSNGGDTTLGPYQPPRRIPYEESLLGKFTGLFKNLGEAEVRNMLATAENDRRAVGMPESEQQTLPFGIPSSLEPANKDAAMRRRAELFGGELPPPPLAGAANMLAAAGYGFPTTLEGLGGKPFTEPTPALRTAPSDLRPGDKAPSPALRAAPPAPTGPTAPTGIASLIPRPDQGAIQKEVAESYGGLKDALKRQDDLLKERGAKLTDRADAQSKLLLAMTGFQMAAEASKPGATFLGSAGAAGSEYAKSRIAANEKFADSMDRLADSRAELDVAKAQLGVTQSDKTYERYNNALKAYSEDQDRVQRLRDAALEREDRRAIYKSQILQGEIAGDVRAIDEALLGLPEDDPRHQELKAQRESLLDTYNTLGGSSDTSGLAIARIKMQAKNNLEKSGPYKTLVEQIKMLEAQYAANPTVELGNKLAGARAQQRNMRDIAEAEALSILSGGSMFGAGDLTGEGDISVADAEAEVGD
jgi:hypothetical protein